MSKPDWRTHRLGPTPRSAASALPSVREVRTGVGEGVLAALFVGALSGASPFVQPTTAHGAAAASFPPPNGHDGQWHQGPPPPQQQQQQSPAPSLDPREQQPRRKKGQPERRYTLDQWRTGLYAVAAAAARGAPGVVSARAAGTGEEGARRRVVGARVTRPPICHPLPPHPTPILAAVRPEALGGQGVRARWHRGLRVDHGQSHQGAHGPNYQRAPWPQSRICTPPIGASAVLQVLLAIGAGSQPEAMLQARRAHIAALSLRCKGSSKLLGRRLFHQDDLDLFAACIARFGGMGCGLDDHAVAVMMTDSLQRAGRTDPKTGEPHVVSLS